MSKITKPAGGVDVLGGAYTMYGDTGLCWSNKSNRYVGAKHQGYLAVKHNSEKFLVHRLMAHAYLGLALDSGKKIHVDHKNGNKDDNRVVNLQLLSSAEHAIKTHKGNKNADYSHITAEQIISSVKSVGWLNACKVLGVSAPDVLKNLYRRLTGENPFSLQQENTVEIAPPVQLSFDFENSWIETTL